HHFIVGNVTGRAVASTHYITEYAERIIISPVVVPVIIAAGVIAGAVGVIGCSGGAALGRCRCSDADEKYNRKKRFHKPGSLVVVLLQLNNCSKYYNGSV